MVAGFRWKEKWQVTKKAKFLSNRRRCETKNAQKVGYLKQRKQALRGGCPT